MLSLSGESGRGGGRVRSPCTMYIRYTLHILYTTHLTHYTHPSPQTVMSYMGVSVRSGAAVTVTWHTTYTPSCYTTQTIRNTPDTFHTSFSPAGDVLPWCVSEVRSCSNSYSGDPDGIPGRAHTWPQVRPNVRYMLIQYPKLPRAD